jgi:predicted enzyme related to lactoylglutathione lyase
MPSIMHFEIHADDLDRAMKFYIDTFDWKFNKWEGSDSSMEYWLVRTKEKGEPGIDGGMMKRQTESPMGSEPFRSFVCTVGVDSLDEYAKKITDNGGKLTTEKMEVMDVGWMYYAEDTEGNLFGIIQMKDMPMG